MLSMTDGLPGQKKTPVPVGAGVVFRCPFLLAIAMRARRLRDKHPGLHGPEHSHGSFRNEASRCADYCFFTLANHSDAIRTIIDTTP